MRIAAIVSLVLVVLGLAVWMLRKRAGSGPAARARMRPKFRVGQVWTYKTRPHEAASRLTIVRTEWFGRGNAVHVHVSDLSIQNPGSPTGISTFITHMPFAEQALQESVIQRVGQARPLPDFEGAYVAWKKKADAKRAGVFTIGVAEAIDGIERAFADGTPPHSSRFSA